MFLSASIILVKMQYLVEIYNSKCITCKIVAESCTDCIALQKSCMEFIVKRDSSTTLMFLQVSCKIVEGNVLRLN